MTSASFAWYHVFRVILMFSIQNASEKDLPVLCGLLQEANVECDEASLREALASGMTRAMIMDLDGPSGCCVWTVEAVPGTGKRSMTVDTVYVSPRLRGQGFETLLFENLARIAERDMYDSIRWKKTLGDWGEGIGTEQDGVVLVEGTEQIAKLWGRCHCHGQD